MGVGGGKRITIRLAQAINAGGLAVFTDATRCLSALAVLTSFAAAEPIWAPRAEPPATTALPPETARLLAGAGPLDEVTSKAILRAWGIRASEGRLVTSAHAAAAARDLGFPVALKACAAGLAHKSEHGLVTLGLLDAEAVRAAAADLESRLRARQPATPEACLLVERMAPPGGVEVVVGARRDTTFGPIVMVGLGGVFVEFLDDVVFGLAPVGHAQAAAMVRALRAHALLAGARGRPPVDEPALVDAVVAVSELAWSARDRVAEIDVNPLIVLRRGQGAIAVDALVVTDR